MATVTIRKTSVPQQAEATIPPLENGDHLTRDEFERRYEAMPGLKKAELIEGVVYMPSPVSHEKHGHPHFHVCTWLGLYESATPGVQGGDNGSVRLDLDNEPQPDAYLFITPECGGQARTDADGFIEGAPELVVEVASSSVSYDLGNKLNVYRRHGVREYVVWRVRDGEIDWYVLHEGKYERLAPGADGTLHSTVFPGLRLDPAAMLRGDLARVLAVVQEGLNAPEHRAFVEELARRKAPSAPTPADPSNAS